MKIIKVFNASIACFLFLSSHVIALDIKSGWKAIREAGKKLSSSVASQVKQVKDTGKLTVHSITFVKVVQKEMEKITMLLDSIKRTASNLGKASNVETQRVVFDNFMSKAGELFVEVFSILDGLNALMLEAETAKLVSKDVASKLNDALFSCYVLMSVSLNYIKDGVGPQTINFLSDLNSIKEKEEKAQKNR